MGIISETFPSVEVVLEIKTEELAVSLLECLCRFDESKSIGMLNRYNFTLPNELREYAGEAHFNAIQRKVAEAWQWLDRQGLIAPKPGSTGDWIIITEKGYELRKTKDFEQFKVPDQLLLLSKKLDPRLAEKTRPELIRRKYGSAVFEAFKEVEIRVRTLAGLGLDDYGQSLMRKAFNPESGILRDSEQPYAERKGIADLFVGAIASFKNPGSHRDINIEDPEEVEELILLANLLIRIAERRKPVESS